MKSLYLIGTAHQDLKGPKRLEKMLRSINPKVIGVEAHEAHAKQWIMKHQQAVRDSPKNQVILSLAYGEKGAENIIRYFQALAYETWVTEEYRRDNQETKVHHIDQFDEKLISMIARYAPMLEEDLEEKSKDMTGYIARRNPLLHQQEIDFKYDDPSEDVKRIKSCPGLFEVMIKERDIHVEAKIRELLDSSEGTIVYIGGNMHFFGEYENNLYDRLSDLNPIRKKLKEADQIK